MLPWEDDVKEAVSKAGKFLTAVNDATSCSLGAAVAQGGAYYYRNQAQTLAAEAGREVAAATSKIASRFAVVGIVLGIAGAAGLC